MSEIAFWKTCGQAGHIDLRGSSVKGHYKIYIVLTVSGFLLSLVYCPTLGIQEENLDDVKKNIIVKFFLTRYVGRLYFLILVLINYKVTNIQLVSTFSFTREFR